jgi:NAD(P)-dependent dehydrogenase (short-subunit alcohol dehydrogenase family)
MLLSYSSSKTALNAITVQYARELAGTAIKVNSCAPGKCATDLNGHDSQRTAAQGAKVAVGLATVDDSGPSGGYFDENGAMDW